MATEIIQNTTNVFIALYLISVLVAIYSLNKHIPDSGWKKAVLRISMSIMWPLWIWAFLIMCTYWHFSDKRADKHA